LYLFISHATVHEPQQSFHPGEKYIMFSRIPALLPAISLALITAPAVAQDRRPQNREGFGISFAVGAGSAELSCGACESDRETGLSGYLRIGGYIGPRLLLAGESHGWTKSEGGVDHAMGFYTMTAQWYPSETSGFYLKGGVGLSRYQAETDLGEISGNSTGSVLGFGYDFRVGTRFSLTPFFNYLKSGDLDLEFDGIGLGLDVSSNVYQAGLGFSWH
jgi:opacity protein-like surface antigen